MNKGRDCVLGLSMDTEEIQCLEKDLNVNKSIEAPSSTSNIHDGITCSSTPNSVIESTHKSSISRLLSGEHPTERQGQKEVIQRSTDQCPQELISLANLPLKEIQDFRPGALILNDPHFANFTKLLFLSLNKDDRSAQGSEEQEDTTKEAIKGD